jgi:hypothetical protein
MRRYLILSTLHTQDSRDWNAVKQAYYEMVNSQAEDSIERLCRRKHDILDELELLSRR